MADAKWVRDPRIPRPYGWGITGFGGAWGKPIWTPTIVSSSPTDWTKVDILTGALTWTAEKVS
jgi:hypothetical protein